MRGVQRVAEQHDALAVPARVADQREVQPLDEVLRQQRLAVEVLAKDLLEEARTSAASLIASSPAARQVVLAALDDEGARVAVELVGMRGIDARSDAPRTSASGRETAVGVPSQMYLFRP